MSNPVSLRFIECHNRLIADNVIRSSRQFAIALDYLPQGLSEILKGRRDVTIELLRKAVEVFKVNPNYLLMGLGNLFIDQESGQKDNILTVVTDHQNIEKIVYVPVAAQAGYGGSIHEPIFFKELPTFSLPGYNFHHGTHRCFDVAGDSMIPTLVSGDKVVGSFLEKESWPYSIKDNFVYVVVTRSDVLVKRIANRIKESGIIEIFSDNDYYQPYTMEIDDVVEIWHVKVKISSFLASSIHKTEESEDIKDLSNKLQKQSDLIYDLNVTIEKLFKQQRSRI